MKRTAQQSETLSKWFDGLPEKPFDEDTSIISENIDMLKDSIMSLTELQVDERPNIGKKSLKALADAIEIEVLMMQFLRDLRKEACNEPD